MTGLGRLPPDSYRTGAHALLHEHIAPRFERICPMRAALIGIHQLGVRCAEIAMLEERYTPGVVRAHQEYRHASGSAPAYEGFSPSPA
jgi:hypothetical protein